MFSSVSAGLVDGPLFFVARVVEFLHVGPSEKQFSYLNPRNYFLKWTFRTAPRAVRKLLDATGLSYHVSG
jgi:hypothetical protein